MFRIKESNKRIKPLSVRWVCFGFYKILNKDTTERKVLNLNTKESTGGVSFFLRLKSKLRGFKTLYTSTYQSSVQIEIILSVTIHTSSSFYKPNIIIISCRNVYIQNIQTQTSLFTGFRGQKHHISEIIQILINVIHPNLFFSSRTLFLLR